MSRAKTSEDRIREAILKSEMEKQLRCGDGTGGIIYSHSLNCRCDRLNADIERLQKQLSEVK